MLDEGEKGFLGRNWERCHKAVENTDFTQPSQNLWLGTSISTQADADKNIPILLQIPAAVRFVSIEPMLEQIDLRRYLGECEGCGYTLKDCKAIDRTKHLTCCPDCKHISVDWVIIGCESGPGARLCSLDDIRYVRDQCKEAGVPVFIKQITLNGKCNKYPDQWPEEFQIQEYPK